MSEPTRILLIDDEEDFCFFVKGNLEATGRFRVLTASDGREGLEVARKSGPDLILLDMIMPEMSGDEVAFELENDPALRDIPVIFLTAIVTKQETGRDNLALIGGRNFIAKPVQTQGLIKAIQKALQTEYPV
ncbi:MAG: response regulator [Desulfohalobiaceae bacterium]|nr:response regulator [Desulfohalobiaceae bacterium]